jgi:hypothetical protein
MLAGGWKEVIDEPLLGRLPRGSNKPIWLRGIILEPIPGVDPAVPIYERYRIDWRRVKWKYAVDYYRGMGLDPSAIIGKLKDDTNQLTVVKAPAILKDAKPKTERASPVILDPSTRSVRFGDREAEISTPKAFSVLQLIVDAGGDVVTSEEIRKKVPACNGRIGLFLDRHLPGWVRNLIKGTRGHHGGFSLQPPKKVRNGALRVRNRT